ncbi:MAG: class I SAM-dependent methyltransferase [Candidatus Methanofastidiosia archaeon]
MEAESHDNWQILEAYWEGVREKWERTEQEGGFGYRTYKKRLETVLEGVATSLEIGFGDGRWTRFLREQGIDAYGIDMLENAAKNLKKQGFSPVVADARKLPFKNNIFDLTYSFGVVEHFEGTEKAILEHIRVTKPGGKIVITVPYLLSPHTLYWMFLHMKRGTFKHRPATFGKRYTRGALMRILEHFEVEIHRIDPFFFPLPGLRRIYHDNPVLERMGLMLWAEMTKQQSGK